MKQRRKSQRAENDCAGVAAQTCTTLPNEIDTASENQKARRNPNPRRDRKGEPGQREKQESNLGSVKIGQEHAGRLTNDGLHGVGRDLLVIEFARPALRDQAGGDVKGKEVLEFDIAGAVQQAGRRKVDGAHSPQAKRENEGVRTNATAE